jgi:hypothetical protein
LFVEKSVLQLTNDLICALTFVKLLNHIKEVAQQMLELQQTPAADQSITAII